VVNNRRERERGRNRERERERERKRERESRRRRRHALLAGHCCGYGCVLYIHRWRSSARPFFSGQSEHY
jgi:hypothetical protein